MLPKERGETGQNDIFRSRLDQFIDLTHPQSMPPTTSWERLADAAPAIGVPIGQARITTIVEAIKGDSF